MQITEVTYKRLFNPRPYENQEIRLTARVDPGDDPDAVIAALRERVAAHDPVLVEARAIVADPRPERWGGRGAIRDAYALLGEEMPPEVAAALAPRALGPMGIDEAAFFHIDGALDDELPDEPDELDEVCRQVPVGGGEEGPF